MTQLAISGTHTVVVLLRASLPHASGLHIFPPSGVLEMIQKRMKKRKKKKNYISSQSKREGTHSFVSSSWRWLRDKKPDRRKKQGKQEKVDSAG